MNFRQHSEIEGMHALLSPSKSYWLNYDEQKLERYFRSSRAAQHGTELHALAKEMIRLRVRPQKIKSSFNRYVNDAISFDMVPEQILWYSCNCFGTADAISFDGEWLRIHDLKTGITPPSMNQLMIYAALFCLEYGEDPNRFQTELRIYSPSEIMATNPTPENIEAAIAKIVFADSKIEELKMEGFS